MVPWHADRPLLSLHSFCADMVPWYQCASSFNSWVVNGENFLCKLCSSACMIFFGEHTVPYFLLRFFFKSFLVIWSNIHHVACRDIYLLSSINLKDVEKQRKIWEKLLFDIEIFMEKVDMFRCLTVRLWWLPSTATAATCKYCESVRTSMKAYGVLFSFF